VFLDTRQQLLAPGFDVVLVAALEQHEEAHAAHATGDLLRMQGFLQELCEFNEDFFAGDRADVALDRAEFVDLDDADTAHAAGGRHGKACFDCLEHLAPMQEPGRRVRAHGIVQVLGHLPVVFLGRGQNESHTRIAIVLAKCEHQLDGQGSAIGENRVHLQGVIVPASLEAGGEGAPQR
jgi:hypothetical protein